ncbi:hypothetical protein F5Y00DRAFT_69611 [Daldinia vernicosa]|uniref:uncharacterized protein n=1 Tax=Daldinia vernicosa TaxID=114800 RepID=UPI002008BCE1|nr:uncharacterized protein F5Y00DRAFT_69611 [Daldinia vernicosa]KAI0849241.1 hypothetical protein F5Y00DRAFT_69611 [Daldinia vernicosa]
MSNTYSFAAASAAGQITGRRVFSVSSPREHHESGQGFDFSRPDNLSRAFAVESLQFYRSSIVEREAIYRSLSDCLLTYSEEFKEVVSLCVGKPDGVFAHDRQFKLPDKVDAVRQVVAKNMNLLDGSFYSYKPIFNRVRKSLYSFWVVPVDGVWVLIVMYLVNYYDEQKHANRKMSVSRIDGESITARFIRVYDVVDEGRLERRKRIRERLPTILKEGDIDIPDIDGKYPSFAGVEGLPTLFNRSHESGLLIHMLVEHLFERLENVVQKEKNPYLGTIRQRLHNRYEEPFWSPIRLPANPGTLYRARGRMIGNLMTGMSGTNQWQATAAIELPDCEVRMGGGSSSILNSLSLAEDVQGDGNESLI